MVNFVKPLALQLDTNTDTQAQPAKVKAIAIYCHPIADWIISNISIFTPPPRLQE